MTFFDLIEQVRSLSVCLVLKERNNKWSFFLPDFVLIAVVLFACSEKALHFQIFH